MKFPEITKKRIFTYLILFLFSLPVEFLAALSNYAVNHDNILVFILSRPLIGYLNFIPLMIIMRNEKEGNENLIEIGGVGITANKAIEMFIITLSDMVGTLIMMYLQIK